MSRLIRANESAWAQIFVENDKVSRFALPRTRLACKHQLRRTAAELIREEIPLCRNPAFQSNAKNS